MLNAKVEDHRACASAMPEIKERRGSSGQRAGASVDGAAMFHQQQDATGNTELAESRCNFILQDADGELLMSRDCPEFWRGKAESGKLKIEIGAEIPEISESGCDFVLHGADGELLMPQECPEFWRGKAESRKRKIEIGVTQAEMAETTCGFVLQDADGKGGNATRMSGDGKKG